MKKIILVLIFNLFFLTDSYPQKNYLSDVKEVNVSCSGTGQYTSRSSFNWFDDYRFIFNPMYSLDLKTISGYKLNTVILENCTHCMGRNEKYYDFANGIIITNSSITISQKGNTETNTTISRSSGNFSSIDKIYSENLVISRQGSCKNIDVLYAKINEYENFKPTKSSGSSNKENKSINSPNKDKETDTRAKDLLKKIIGK